MRTLFTDLNIQFDIEGITFSALNIVYETFQTPIPKHSHGHNSFELHYIPFGLGTVKISDKTYDVIPNTFYVTGPHVEHEQIPCKKEPMTEYCIYLKIKKNNKKLPATSYLSLFEDTPIWFGQDTQELHGLLQQIFFELEQEYMGYMTQVETLLSQLIVKATRNYKHRTESQKHFSRSNLVDSKHLIAEESLLYEYATITLDKLSSRLGLSTRQTERFIQDCYGKTFLQKKTEAKMSAAAIKLIDTSSGINITDIALELGYSSVEHFSHAFKKYYGITARQFRREHSQIQY